MIPASRLKAGELQFAGQGSAQQTTIADDGAPTAIAFQFVTELAQEVSAGHVDLPAFPDVAMRVRKALSDENVGAEQIARIVGSEPGLAARVLALANSAALNRSGKAITELRTAVSRIGHNNVRTAAVSFAISQLRRAGELRQIIKQLEAVWKEATMVAALAHAIGTRSPGVNSDEAMLGGLMHNVGKIYILARAHKHPTLFADAKAMHSIMRSWHSNIGKAIIENWGFPEQIAEAVGEHENIDRRGGNPDVTDVLTVATMMAAFFGQEADLELNMQGVRAFTRLGLDNAKCAHIMRDCVEEIAALRTALGD
ncbi:MAG: HDOD domain-containing protein [Steroidobacteraceae bacterium]